MAAKIPFEFILEELTGLEITVKPMFGMQAIYHEDKILLILRMAIKKPESNGIWVAVAKDCREELGKDIPALHDITHFKKADKGSHWLLLRADRDDFESSAVELCRLIRKHDPRIGRVPKKTSPAKKGGKTRKQA